MRYYKNKMKKIVKNYIKSLFNDKTSNFTLIIYLIILFLGVFLSASNPIQEYNQWNNILKISKPWTYSTNINSLKKINFDKKGKLPEQFYNFCGRNGKKLLNKKTAEIEIIKQNPDAKTNTNIMRAQFIYDVKLVNLLKTTNKPITLKNNEEINLKNIFNENPMKSINYNFEKGIILNESKNKFKNLKNISNNNMIILYFYSTTKKSPLPDKLVNFSFIDKNEKNNINQVMLENKKSKMPKYNNEILVNKLFAKRNNLKIGQTINLFTYGLSNLKNEDYKKYEKYTYKISGFGINLSNFITNVGGSFETDENTYKNFTNAYFTYEEYKKISEEIQKDYEIIKNPNEKPKKEEEIGTYNFKFVQNNSYDDQILLNNKIDLNYLKEKMNKDGLLSKTNFDNTYKLYINSLIYNFYRQSIIKIITTGVVLIFSISLAIIFINFVIKKDITVSQKTIGIFKSMGYKNNELSWVYSIKTLIILVLTLIFGLILSIPLQIYFNKGINNNYSFMNLSEINYVYWFIIAIFTLIPCLLTIISFFLNLYYLKQPINKLLSGHNVPKNLWLLKISSILFKKVSFSFRLQLSYIIQSLQKWSIIVLVWSFGVTIIIIQFTLSKSLTSNLLNLTLKQEYNFNNVKSIINTKINDNLTITKYKNLIKIPDFYKEKNPDFYNPVPLIMKDGKINPKIEKSIDRWEKDDIFSHLDYIKNPYLKLNDKTIEQINKIPFLGEIFKNIKNYINKDTIISLNKFINDNLNYKNSYAISQKISRYNRQRGYNNNSIIGITTKDIKKYNYFYGNNGIKQNELNKIFDIPPSNASNDNINNLIPVIASKKISIIKNWKIGDIIKKDINNEPIYIWTNNLTKTNQKIKLKIVGISNNLYSTNLISSYNNIARFYYYKKANYDKKYFNYYYEWIKNLDNKSDLSIANLKISNRNLLPNVKTLKDIEIGNPKKTFNLDTFAIFPSPSPNNKESYSTNLFDLIKSIKNNFYLKNATYVPQFINTINNITYNFLIFQWLNLTISFIMITLLLLISISIIISENTKIILVLKSFGYKDIKLSWIFTWNYGVAIIFSLLISIAFSKLILNIINNILIKRLVFFNLSIPYDGLLQIFAFTILVISVSLYFCFGIIKRKELNYISDE